jgi:hypothetical protein
MALNPTWDFARRSDGSGVVDATTLDAATWRALQTTYHVGELLMPCCDSPAIPKSSRNGVPFFAHAGNGCQTSPESQWHLRAKQLVRDAARELGFLADIERPGNTGRSRWCADVWIEVNGVAYVVELQHSYQHLRDYLARQQRYKDSGLQCLWLVMPERYLTLLDAMTRQRRRMDFAGLRTWPNGQGGCIRDFPVALLELDPEPLVRGPGLRSSMTQVLTAFVHGGFRWQDGMWCVGSDLCLMSIPCDH